MSRQSPQQMGYQQPQQPFYASNPHGNNNNNNQALPSPSQGSFPQEHHTSYSLHRNISSGSNGWQPVDNYSEGSRPANESYSSYARDSPQRHPAQLPPSNGGWSSIHPSSQYPNNPSVKQEPQYDARPQTGIRLGHGKIVGNGSGSGSGSGPTVLAVQSSDNRQPSGMGEGSGPGNMTAGPSEFIKKLYRMLEDEKAMYGRGKGAGQPRGEAAKRGSVGWGRGGSTFVVWDMNDFTTKVLPQTFRHFNFSSFVRQLNKYGFSKIKHVDEDTGVIKENVWEFQHPNFQAGGKSDLDSIKRKAVVPKKGAVEVENESSPGPSRVIGFGNEEMARLAEMENRVMGLEDQLVSALNDVREARSREMGLITVVREMLGQMAATEKETVGSPSANIDPSPRMLNLFQLFEQATGISRPTHFPHNGYSHASSFSHKNGQPLSAHRSSGPSTGLTHPSVHAHISPQTDGGSHGSGDGLSPTGSKTPNSARNRSRLPGQDQQDEILEISRGDTHTLYHGESSIVTPLLEESPAWLTEGMTAPINMYHRRSSDGATLRLMVEALAGQNDPRFEMEGQDPLDTTSPRTNIPLNPPIKATIQQSPFGTLIIPPQNIDKTSQLKNPAIRLRRSTTIVPSWSKAPRILVVEDDVVYRQLSSKFLEKFGCITETVENAQGAVEKMNRTKYDLVLMDIFFGPSMDGRKATSLIRQFDMYTPIISMTSNVRTQDVNSYLQSGMNDVLAKPFTKNGLFGILDKHLIHLKAIQLSGEVPRSVGVPPLSHEGLIDAVATGATAWAAQADLIPNPLAGMGWSDETYQLVLQQFMATGTLPNVSAITNEPLNGGTGAGTIGTSLIFGGSSVFNNRKRSLEGVEDDWTPGGTPMGGVEAGNGREMKKVKN